jgi:GntR family transcriptional regulator
MERGTMELMMPHLGGRALSDWFAVTLIKELKTGVYKDSTVLPAEHDLADAFKISRTAVRDAMINLEREGYVERVRGVGTLVHRHVVELTTRVDLDYGYNGMILARGYRPSSDKIKTYLEPSDEHIAKQLWIPVGSDLLVVEKRVLADDKPVIYSIDHMPLSLFQGRSLTEINWHGSLFDTLERHCNVTVDTDITNLSPVMGPPAIRETLLIGENESLILMDEVGYFKLSQPIFHTYGYYTNFFELSVLRKRF